MRHLFALLFTFAWVAGALAQGRSSTQQTDSGRVVLHYFTTGQLSTKEWLDKGGRFGRSLAYDRGGRVIFSYYTRTVGGHATVHFSYHPNGAVSKAEVSDAPDAGIQWYRSTTTWDQEGKQTSFSEEGQDNEGPLPHLRVPVEPVRPQQVPQTSEPEQRLFHNEYFVVNGYRRPCRVEIHPKDLSPAAPEIKTTLLKGDTVRGGDFTMGEQWDDPLKHVDVAAIVAAGDMRRLLAVVHVDTMQVDPEHRRYYLILGKKKR